MTPATILGPLSGLYEMQAQLLESLSETDAARQYHPDLPSLNWLYANGVYLELYWLREIVGGDDSLSQPITNLLTPGAMPLRQQCELLPPAGHLLNWAREIRDEHLSRLANPQAMPKHPLLQHNRLQWYLLQELAKRYEQILTVLLQRRRQSESAYYRVSVPLAAQPPIWQTKELAQGHYRIGSRTDPGAFDNELPPQAVELSSFRIALTPVTNSQYLAFMQAGEYHDPAFWDAAGKTWIAQAEIEKPEYWQQDTNGNWYGIGINGPHDLQPDDPVTGINQFEAQAFANWVGQASSDYHGACLQHEYQWEIAARSGVMQQAGSAWEWCSNRFHSYPEFKPFPDDATSNQHFEQDNFSLRGGSLYTQTCLRRISMRHWGEASQRFHVAGTRLIFPPRHSWTKAQD